MDGISTALTVASIAQAGFSLAQTLNTYVGDVQNGKEDIFKLADEVDATAYRLQELESLIQANDITKGWNDVGLRLAKKTVSDFDRLLKRLRQLLLKSGAAVDGKETARDQIDISAFSRLTWPRLKTDIGTARTELQHIKIDMLLALNTYKAHVNPVEEQRTASLILIAMLWKLRALSTPTPDQTQTDPQQFPTKALVTIPRQVGPAAVPNPRAHPVQPQTREPATGRTKESRHSPRISFRPNSQLNTEDRNRKDQPTQQQNFVRGEATNIEEQDQRTHPEQPGSFRRDSSSNSTGSSSSSSEDLSGLSMPYLWRRKHFKERPKIPFPLKDPNEPGGIAEMTTISFAWDDLGNRWSREIEYPTPLLIKRAEQEERRMMRKTEFCLQAWETMSRLPPHIQHWIENSMETNKTETHFWVLLIVESDYLRPKPWFSRIFAFGYKERNQRATVVYKKCRSRYAVVEDGRHDRSRRSGEGQVPGNHDGPTVPGMAQTDEKVLREVMELYTGVTPGAEDLSHAMPSKEQDDIEPGDDATAEAKDKTERREDSLETPI